VQIVDRIEHLDHISGSRFVSTYSYYHGFFDGVEREFRGFARVDQIDSETFENFSQGGLFSPDATNADALHHLPPVLTRTWFHTGAFLEGESLSQRLAAEYFKGDADPQAELLPDTSIESALSAEEAPEACRALRGQMLRQEIYALDGAVTAEIPYSVLERGVSVRRIQPFGPNRHAVFHVVPRESLDFHYERNAADPRVSHEIVLEVDPFGQVRRSAAVSYARRGSPVQPEQARTSAVYSEHDVLNGADETSWYRIGVPVETRVYDVGLPEPATPGRYRFEEIETALAALTDIPFESTPSVGARRLIERQRTRYYDALASSPLPFGQIAPLGLPFETYTLALTPSLLADVYQGRVTPAMLNDAGYVAIDGNWWLPSGQRTFDPASFYLATGFRDPFGNTATVTYDAYTMLITRSSASEDPAFNLVTEVENDYRVLAPWRITDVNGNRSAAAFDELGLVSATAAMGKDGDAQGDTIDQPTTRFEYDLFNWLTNQQPAFVHTLSREVHQDSATRWQERYEYSDGFGRTAQVKVSAEPAAGQTAARWAVTGCTVFNNKGLAVKQYQPFFSTTSDFESESAQVAAGATSVFHYDPLGRLARVDLPNGTVVRTDFDPWLHRRWDPNDTVLESAWFAERQLLPGGHPERRAADLAAAHADTPAVAHLDPLGRTFLTVSDNGSFGQYPARTVLDIKGSPLSIIDPLGRVVVRYAYDLVGRRLHEASADGGEKWSFENAAGRIVRTWDGRGFETRATYDRLQRPLDRFIRLGSGAERLSDRLVYGDELVDAAARNLRGTVHRQFDGAGVVTTERCDFKGNPLEVRRQFTADYATAPDWSVAPGLDAQSHATVTTYDALNRPTTIETADGSLFLPGYNAAGFLGSLAIRVRGSQPAVPVVEHIDYDARGQRTAMVYGNGAQSEFEFDQLMFRLVRARTVRPSEPSLLQDLNYTQDAAGNIVEIRDDAQQSVYFANAVVAPLGQYEYDPVYRLIRARGREHIGQGATAQVDHDDTPRTRLAHPHDGGALRGYSELYEYDQLGNLLSISHHAANGNWTRRYQYAGDSNRLTATSLPGDAPGQFSAAYVHDLQGNMQAMPHLSAIDWDHRSQIRSVSLGGGGTAYFAYSADGERVRKVIERPGGLVEERRMLGAVEVLRRRQNGALVLERETLHVLDDDRHIARVDTQTVEDGQALATPEPRIHYQFGNHLGTAMLELDADAQVVSYEEYHPYGSTSYQAGPSAAEVSRKRHRYAGRERDEETGLYYCGARYYAPWLGRWTSPDPSGVGDGLNLYWYASADPIRLCDPDGLDPKDKSYPGSKAAPASEPYTVRGNPHKMFLENPNAASNWRKATNTILENIYQKGSPEANLKAFEEHVASKPDGPQKIGKRWNFNSKQGWARYVSLRVQQQFYVQESKAPSWYYTKDQVTKMARGTAPDPLQQVEHLENLAKNPAKAIRPESVYLTEGGKKGGLPKGSPHYEVTHGKTGQDLRAFQEKNASPPAPKPPADAPEPAKPAVDAPETAGTPAKSATGAVKAGSVKGSGWAGAASSVAGKGFMVLNVYEIVKSIYQAARGTGDGTIPWLSVPFGEKFISDPKKYFRKRMEEHGVNVDDLEGKYIDVDGETYLIKDGVPVGPIS
jgi:RHS repeat-associated protein